MSIVREKLVKEDIELGHGTALITDPTDPTGSKLDGSKVGVHTFTEGVYNVMDFGAVGDGVTDDTTEIQLAIDTAGADAVILFPVGDYLISDALTITDSNVVLRGLGARWAGGNGALIQSSNAAANVLTITGVDNVLIENLSLRHKVEANFGTYAIEVLGGSQILINNCSVVSASGTTNSRAGIKLWATATKAIENCRVTGCRFSTIENEGVLINGYSDAYKATNVTILGCSMDNCGSKAIVVGDYCRNISIENCHIFDCAASIHLVATQTNRTEYISIVGCALENALTGNHIGGWKVDHVLVAGNRIADTVAEQYGIWFDTDCEVWNISGCTLIGCLGGGIYLNGDYNLVTSNQIDEAGSGVSITLGAASQFNYVGGNAIANAGGGITDGGAANLNTFGFNYKALAEVLRFRTAAPADAALENQDLTIWVDEGNNNLTFKVKYAAGTVKSGTVALT